MPVSVTMPGSGTDVPPAGFETGRAFTKRCSGFLLSRRRSPETGLLGSLVDEMRWSAAEPSLQGLDLGNEPLLDELGREAA